VGEIRLGQLGEASAGGVVVALLRGEGESIRAGEALFEISSDKVDSEIVSDLSGVVHWRVEVGQEIEVGQVVCVIEEEGGEGSAVSGGVERVDAVATEVEEVSGSSSAPESEFGALLTKSTRGAGVLASPLVRKDLREAGVALEEVLGSGVGGRITRDDAQRAIHSLRMNSDGGDSFEDAQSDAAERAGETLLVRTPMRRAISLNMEKSASEIPQAYICREVGFDGVELGRELAKAAGERLTYLPFILHATALALREWPRLNAVWRGGEVYLQDSINMGIAIDLKHEGLVVPVLRGVSRMGVTGTGLALAELARRARNGQLGSEDMRGGTISVTNDGPFGTSFTVPLVNPGQVAIVATDGVRRKPVVRVDSTGKEGLGIGSIGMIGVSFDHRVVDGAYVSEFLASLAREIEETDWREILRHELGLGRIN